MLRQIFHTASTAAAIAVASELLTAERLGASQPTANNKELTAKAAAITLEICKEMHFDLKPQNLKISVAASNNQAVARTIFHPFSRQHEIQLGKNLQTNLKNLEARTPYTQDEYLRAILGHEIVHAKEHHQFFHIFAPAFVTLSLSKTFQKLPLFNGRPGYKTAMIIGLGILNFTLVERFMSRQIEQRADIKSARELKTNQVLIEFFKNKRDCAHKHPLEHLLLDNHPSNQCRIDRLGASSASSPSF